MVFHHRMKTKELIFTLFMYIKQQANNVAHCSERGKTNLVDRSNRHHCR